MFKLNFIVVFILVGFLFSCSLENEKYVGQWELIVENETIGVVIIDKKELAFFGYSETKCDSSFILPSIYKIEHTISLADSTKLLIKDEYQNLELALGFQNGDSGEFIFTIENEILKAGRFTKSRYNLKANYNPDENCYRDYNNSLFEQMLQVQNDFTLLKEDVSLSKESIKLLNYINSFRDFIFQKSGLAPSEIFCLSNSDHKLASLKPNLFNEDSDSIYNVRKLEKRLTYYLTSNSDKTNVKIIFPTFNKDQFFEITSDKVRTDWADMNFSGSTMGESILKLEMLKFKILQIEGLKE